MTPREEFVTAENLARAYVWHHLDIGFGVTITGPHTVARMTNTLAIKPGDKVLEIGTGSGYQSAYLSYLTDKLWSIEIQPPLAKRTRAVYDALILRGYHEYAAISTKNADGYYGWEDAAPFDKIIVTCGIDHIPPPLLRQLKPGGIMVIPVGPPGAQHVIKAVKTRGRRRRLQRRPFRHLRRRDHPFRALHRRPSGNVGLVEALSEAARFDGPVVVMCDLPLSSPRDVAQHDRNDRRDARRRGLPGAAHRSRCALDVAGSRARFDARDARRAAARRTCSSREGPPCRPSARA